MPSPKTFDPKPAAPSDYRGPYRSIHTNVPGIDVSELLPRLATIADKYTLLRSVAHTGGGHPAGSPQAYSEHLVDTGRATCTTWPRGNWIYSSDTFGGTEGGSSGSPVLNSAGQVVGQLSGGCGFNVSDICDSVQNATVDGAFAAYFPDIAQFLDPDASCTDADNDGFCVEDGDCDDADPAINPGASEVCDDGVDNDCDGLLDDADPACQTSSCDLLPLGDSCVSNDECCSQKCKGRPGARTCR